MLHCISVKNLKYYYSHFPAIDNISFDVEQGKVFGMLGANGAGKTTTIKILTTLLRPSAGTVTIFGKDLQKNALEIRKRIGVVLQKPSAEPRLTVEKALDLYGQMWGLNSIKRKNRIIELLEIFDLKEIRNIKNDNLSIGQRRRVQVAREFMHDFDLLFLDEPTVGLDPSARRLLLKYIKDQVSKGLTVFFTTHIMEEAEYLCDKIIVINKGKIIALDTPSGLKDKYGVIKHIEIQVKQNDVSSIIAILKSSFTKSYSINSTDENTIKIGSIDTQDTITKTVNILSENGIMINNINITSSSFEDAFLNIISKEGKKTDIQINI